MLLICCFKLELVQPIGNSTSFKISLGSILLISEELDPCGTTCTALSIIISRNKESLDKRLMIWKVSALAVIAKVMPMIIATPLALRL